MAAPVTAADPSISPTLSFATIVILVMCCASLVTVECVGEHLNSSVSRTDSSLVFPITTTTPLSSTSTPSTTISLNASLSSVSVPFDEENFIDDYDDDEDHDDNDEDNNRSRSVGQSSFDISTSRPSSLFPTDVPLNVSLKTMNVSVAFRREFDFSQVQSATQHMFFIRNQWACGAPKPKLVKVQDFHASASKAYVPRCTVLHRCGDESGCCEDVTHRCEPAKSELVELYFHVIRSDVKNNITGGNAVGIEKLTFLNHTRCECRPINYQPRSFITRPPMRFFINKKNLTSTPKFRNERLHHNKCRHVIKCAQPFMYRFRELDQRCICDCISPIVRGITSDTHQKCVDIQLGTDRLDHFGARCVRSGECTEPICAIGLVFSSDEAKCVPHKQASGLLQSKFSLPKHFGLKKFPFHVHHSAHRSRHRPSNVLPLKHTQTAIPHHHHRHSHHHHKEQNNNNNSTHHDQQKTRTMRSGFTAPTNVSSQISDN